MVRQLLVFFVALLAGGFSGASTQSLSDGLYRMTLDGAHVGYVIQRYEYDTEKGEFISTFFRRSAEPGGILTESLKARANSRFEPLAYEYRWSLGSAQRHIQAQFTGRQMTAQFQERGPESEPPESQRQVSLEIPEKAFLSTFLSLLMHQQGLSLEKLFNYQVVLEEEARIASGQARVASRQEQKGHKGQTVFVVEHNLKVKGPEAASAPLSTPYRSHITPEGLLLKTELPVQRLVLEKVEQKPMALGSLELPIEQVQNLFGSLPQSLQGESEEL